jgi:hypothetical protein
VLDEVYKEALLSMLSDKLKITPDSRVIGFDRLEDHDVLMRVYSACLDALYDDVRSSMSYCSDINLGKVNNDISRADVSLTIVLTISSLKDAKYIVTLHDYLTPDVILAKLHLP